MEEALRALNQMTADGVIREYAIGGAIGAAFYIKAAQTEDLDVFVFLPTQSHGLMLLTPIYEAAAALGGLVDREHVRFGQWPVQILTDANALIAEAIEQAVTIDFSGTQTRVFRAEHLCAIALQTGRQKDYLRVRMFIEQDAVDRAALDDVLRRFALSQTLEPLLP